MTTNQPAVRFDPPVKVACLSCRASRIRCDGQPVCRNCSTKGRECVYTKSRRGGPRVSRRQLAAVEAANTASKESSAPPTHPQEQPRPSLADMVEALIFPGAGLDNLDSQDETATAQNEIDVEMHQSSPVLARTYSSDDAILNAYYVFIHAYFPILPPPSMPVVADEPTHGEGSDHQPASPVTLALAAILALIPHPTDHASHSQRSRLVRREQAHLFAQLAMESIEVESEIPESTLAPAEALNCSNVVSARKSVHPDVPVELESTLALLVLSVYEYAQRGNLAKMRNRASQALDCATRMGLHEISAGPAEPFLEAKSRAWWMTYICVLQSCIVSNTSSFIDVYHSSYTTPYPTIDGDPVVWTALLDAQRTIMTCTKHCLRAPGSQSNTPGSVEWSQTTRELDAAVQMLLAIYPSTAANTRPSAMDMSEAALIPALQAQAQIKLHSARIKLHRRQAFEDVPIFPKRHCDLKSSSDPEFLHILGPQCSSLQGQLDALSGWDGTDTASLPWPVGYISAGSPRNVIAAKTCLDSALEICKVYEVLPYPTCPTAEIPQPSDTRTPQIRLPRTMPAFVCSVMQSCYVLLLLGFQNDDLMYSGHGKAPLNESTLYTGLQSLVEVLDNYSVAFEAIQGMANQVTESFEAAKAVLLN